MRAGSAYSQAGQWPTGREEIERRTIRIFELQGYVHLTSLGSKSPTLPIKLERLSKVRGSKR